MAPDKCRTNFDRLNIRAFRRSVNRTGQKFERHNLGQIFSRRVRPKIWPARSEHHNRLNFFREGFDHPYVRILGYWDASKEVLLKILEEGEGEDLLYQDIKAYIKMFGTFL